MKKVRNLGCAFIAATGLMIGGAGLATADEATTPAATPIDDSAVGTGSASSMLKVIQALISGSAGTTDPDTTDPTPANPAPTTP